jgi:hypothetical protein
MSSNAPSANEIISHRIALFKSLAEQLGLRRTLRSIEAAISGRGDSGNWNRAELNYVFDVFRDEAATLDFDMKFAILLLDELMLGLQSSKVSASLEKDVFRYTVLAYESSDSFKIDSTLGALHESVDFLLSQEQSTDTENPAFAKAATYLAMISHLVRLETRGRALKETFRSILRMTGKGESASKEAERLFSDFIKIRYVGAKKSDVESIRDAIAHANFRDLGNQKIRFSVKYRGNEFDEILTYTDILVMNNRCEKKITVAEMYFFLMVTLKSRTFSGVLKEESQASKSRT